MPSLSPKPERASMRAASSGGRGLSLKYAHVIMGPISATFLPGRFVRSSGKIPLSFYNNNEHR
jgi:hypothetical protein